MTGPNWLEIIIPIRDPGDKFLETVKSLIAQTERGFGVVCSDNHSKRGSDILHQGCEQLRSAGVPVRLVSPPMELMRVEHWNWAHAQGSAHWLKPLFVGDLINPDYVMELRQRTAGRPDASVVRCDFTMNTESGAMLVSEPDGIPLSLNPAQFLEYYPHLGNWLGGPVNFAYAQVAWRSSGGYDVHLPACGDLNLFVTMILRCGLELIPKNLATFQLHDQRFSKGISRRRVNGLIELWMTLRQVRNYCASVNLPWNRQAMAAGLWYQAKIDYIYPARRRLKQSFKRQHGAEP